jgi:HEAT repeat protein
MRSSALRCGLLLSLLAPPALVAQTPDVSGHGRPSPVPLGELVEQADRIFVLRLARITSSEKYLLFQPTVTLKGRPKTANVCIEAIADESLLEWAKPGKKAVCFVFSSGQLLCLGNHWLTTLKLDRVGEPSVWKIDERQTETWQTTYVGSVDRLRQHVRAIRRGHRVVITAQAPERDVFAREKRLFPRNWHRGQKGRVWRIEAGLKVKPPRGAEGTPGFVGWGVGGPEAVPLLIRKLRSRDALVRAEAIEDLGRLGALARPALDRLRPLLLDHDPHVRIYTVLALARIDPKAKPELHHLTTALKDSDIELRAAALDALTELGCRTEAVLDILTKALADESYPELRAAAAQALGKIGPEKATTQTVLALSKIVRSESDAETRLQALGALLRLGAVSWEAVPALNAVLCDKENQTRQDELSRAAARVLVRLEPFPAEVLAASLGEAPAGDEKPWLTQSPALLGPRARTLAPALRRILACAPPEHQEWAAATLLQIEGPAAAASLLPLLLARVQDKELVSGAAIEMLGKLGSAARLAVPMLVKLLKHENEEIQRASVVALGRIGSGSAEAVKALRALSEESPRLRVVTAQALASLGEKREAVGLLIRAVQRDVTQNEAADALSALGPQARAAIPTLKQALEKDPGHGSLAWALWSVEHPVPFDRPRRRAGAVLVRIRSEKYDDPLILDPDSLSTPEGMAALEEGNAIRVQTDEQLRLLATDPKPIPALTKALKDPRPEVRLVAALTLAHLDPSHVEPPAVLARLLAQRFDRLPYLADTLAELGPRARVAIPTLLEMQRHENDYLYRTATRLLRQIDPQAARSTWHVLGARAGRPASPLTPKEREALWSDLAADPVRSYLAQCRLARDGAATVAFLGQHLPPVSVIPAQRIALRIAELDSDHFDVRERAAAQLCRMLDQAEPLLHRALAIRSSPEVRHRIRQMLPRLDPFVSALRRRPRRVLETLELLDCPESRAQLRRLAGGAPGAWLTLEAKATLSRLERRLHPNREQR